MRSLKKTDVRLSPVRTSGTDKNRFFDFGKHYFAVLEIEAESAGPQEITLAVGEVLGEDGKIDREPGGSRVYQEQTVVLASGVNRIAMQMRHKAYEVTGGMLPITPEAVPFRYAEVRGFSGSLKAFQHAYYYEFDDAASDFVSSSDELNRIWELCKHTMKATTPFGVFIDGDRERQAYEGDTYINQLSYFVCQSEPSIPGNTIDRLFAYPTWPTEWWLSMIPVIRDHALYTGDLERVRGWYGPMKKKLLLDGIGENGLLNVALLPPVDLPGFPKMKNLRDIVDWPLSERDGYEFGACNLVPNCWQYMALRRAAEIAALLDEKEDVRFFEEKASQSRKAIRAAMLKKGLFVDNPESDHTSLHSCIFPALWNVADPAEKPAILQLLRSKGLACSVFAAQFLLECCYENRLADHGLQLMLSRGTRSWLNMLEKDATITMEAWDDSVKPNQDWNHPWGAAPGNILVRYLCGIRPLEPGFRKFIVDPQPGGLRSFKVKTPTPHGAIELEMSAPGRYRLTVPEGTTALFQGKTLPAGTHE